MATKKQNFYTWFDKIMNDKFGVSRIFSWSPHQIFENPVGIIRDIGYEIKWAYQRVKYGVDERASWGVGYWLMDIMPKILKRIKGSEYGVPLSFFEDDALDGSEPKESDIEIASQKYDDAIKDILWGFEEMKRLEEVKVYGKDGIGIEEYKHRMTLAKEKISILIKYFHEIGD